MAITIYYQVKTKKDEFFSHVNRTHVDTLMALILENCTERQGRCYLSWCDQNVLFDEVTSE